MDRDEWITGGEENTLNIGLIGAGGYGEIHKVLFSLVDPLLMRL